MSSRWLAFAFEVLGILCLLGALVVHGSRPLFGIVDGLERWRQFQKRISLAAVGAGLMIAGLIIFYVELFPPAHFIP